MPNFRPKKESDSAIYLQRSRTEDRRQKTGDRRQETEGAEGVGILTKRTQPRKSKAGGAEGAQWRAGGTAYQDVLALWKDADPDIPILKQAQAEYARLQ